VAVVRGWSPASPVLLPTGRPSTHGYSAAAAAAAVAATVRGALGTCQGTEAAVRRGVAAGARPAEAHVAAVATERSDDGADRDHRCRK